MKQNSNFTIISYKTNTIELGIRFDQQNKNVWLTQEEMSKLFGINLKTLSRHINAIEND